MEMWTMLKKVVTICAVLLLSMSGAMAQMKQGAMAAARACRPDMAQFCGNVAPGQGRIKACMKEHLPELSEPCKEALFQAWLHQ
jgi:Cysteine rich repeat